MKKLLSLFLLSLIFMLSACTPQDTSATLITLNKIGDFSNQPEDAAASLSLPDGMAGNGIKVTNMDNENLVGERADLQYAGQPIDLFVTLYNANSYENEMALIVVSDQKQSFFHIDNSQSRQYVHKVIMPAYSYTVVPIRLMPEDLPDGLFEHDLWILSIGDVQIDMGDGTVKALRRAMGYQLHLVSGDPYWAAEEIEELIPQGVHVSEMNSVITPRAKINTSDKTRIFVRDGKAAGTMTFCGRHVGLAQTFLLMDYQAVPLTADGDSIFWYEQTGEETVREFSINGMDILGKEVFLLTLPVGRDGMPDVSERYILTEQ